MIAVQDVLPAKAFGLFVRLAIIASHNSFYRHVLDGKSDNRRTLILLAI